MTCVSSLIVAAALADYNASRRARSGGGQLHHQLALFTPANHPLAPSPELLWSLELSRFQPTHLRRNASKMDIYHRHAPPEPNFFAQLPHLPNCPVIAQRIPPPGRQCDHEPKFSCGQIARRPDPSKGPPCHVWSIGSAGETCFEEFVHESAPHCEIHSFDPTLSVAAERHMQQLAAAKVLHYHQLGLSDRAGHYSRKRYRDSSSSIECNEGDVFSNGSKYSARQRARFNCLEMRVATLAQMVTTVRTESARDFWIVGHPG